MNTSTLPNFCPLTPPPCSPNMSLLTSCIPLPFPFFLCYYTKFSWCWSYVHRCGTLVKAQETGQWEQPQNKLKFQKFLMKGWDLESSLPQVCQKFGWLVLAQVTTAAVRSYMAEPHWEDSIS